MNQYEVKRLIDRRLRLMGAMIKGKATPEKIGELAILNTTLQEANILPKDSYSQEPSGKIVNITGTTWTIQGAR